MSRVRERPSTSEAHNDFWCGMSGVHAGGDAKLLIKFAWPYCANSLSGLRVAHLYFVLRNIPLGGYLETFRLRHDVRPET